MNSDSARSRHTVCWLPWFAVAGMTTIGDLTFLATICQRAYEETDPPWDWREALGRWAVPGAVVLLILVTLAATVLFVWQATR